MMVVSRINRHRVRFAVRKIGHNDIASRRLSTAENRNVPVFRLETRPRRRTASACASPASRSILVVRNAKLYYTIIIIVIIIIRNNMHYSVRSFLGTWHNNIRLSTHTHTRVQHNTLLLSSLRSVLHIIIILHTSIIYLYTV